MKRIIDHVEIMDFDVPYHFGFHSSLIFGFHSSLIKDIKYTKKEKLFKVIKMSTADEKIAKLNAIKLYVECAFLSSMIAQGFIPRNGNLSLRGCKVCYLDIISSVRFAFHKFSLFEDYIPSDRIGILLQGYFSNGFSGGDMKDIVDKIVNMCVSDYNEYFIHTQQPLT